MNVVKHTLVAGSIATLALLAGCGNGGGGTVAKVDGSPITMDEYRQAMEFRSAVQVRVPEGLVLGILQAAQADQLGNVVNQVVPMEVAGSVGFQALQDLVNQEVLFLLAKEENIQVTTEDIEAEIKFQRELDPNFLQRYQNMGMNMGMIRERVRISLVEERLLTKGITVTMDEVDRFIADNPQQFTEPANAQLRWILVPTADRARVDAELATGQDFSVVARQFSRAPNAVQLEGRYTPGPVPIAQLPQEIRPRVVAAQAGAVTDWIPDGQGNIAKFLIEQKSPERKVELTEPRRKLLQRAIARDKGARAKDLGQRLADKRNQLIKDAKIVVEYDALEEQWKNFEEAVKRAEAGTEVVETGVEAEAEKAAQPGQPAAGGQPAAPAAGAN